MKITKFEHACFAVEENGQSIIVDPGNWTTNLAVPENIIAVVVTHEHADHFNTDNLQAILDSNPGLVVLAHESVTSQLDGFKTTSVVANEGIKVGDFELEFFGGEHATIIEGMPTIANLGVMINNRLYYPGDSFAVPEQPVEILALPVSAPWMKFNEAVTFVDAVKPQMIFPTHDAILSQPGKDLADTLSGRAAEKVGAKYQRIDSTPLET